MNMKSVMAALLIGSVLYLTGCTNFTSNLTLDTVGPAPVSVHAASLDAGSLVVYSAFEVNADFNNEDPYRHEYSNYRIFTDDGRFLQFVKNDNGTSVGNPTAVSLPAGKYLVKAHANGRGTVTVPVIIVNGRTTAVHLETGGAQPDKIAADH